MAGKNSTDTAKRFSVLALPYEKKDMSIAKELMVDYDTGHIYVRDKDGVKILSITKELESLINNLTNNGGDNIVVTNPEDQQDEVLNTVLDNIFKYINAAVEGLTIKKPARVLAETNINQLNGLPGDIDGVTVNDGDDVLLIGQNDKTKNGKWKVVANGDWVRSDDLNGETELVRSAFLFISEGDKYKETGWVLVTDNPVLGTSELEWQIFTRSEEIIAGTGLQRIGNEISLKPTTTAGTGIKVTWDEYGKITGYEEVDSLEDLGITNAVPISHIGSGGDQHTIVTPDEHGFASKEDKNIIDSVMPTIENLENETNIKIDAKSEIEFIENLEDINVTLEDQLPIVDDLTSDLSTVSLSARQGKVLKDLLDYLFTNTNEEGSPYVKLWMGTLNQYYNVQEKDPNTIYYSTDTISENTAITLGSGIEEIIMMIQLLSANKVSKSGDQVTGPLIVGSSASRQHLKVYGDIYKDGLPLQQVFADIDHDHDNVVTTDDFDNKLKKKADKVHRHKIVDVDGLQDVLDLKSDVGHTHEESYYNREEVDFKLSQRAPMFHKHTVEDILGLIVGDGNSDGILEVLYLRDLKQDPLHRTVTDSQIAKWEKMSSGGGNNIGTSIDISSHDNDPNAHRRILSQIEDISDDIGHGMLLSNKDIKSTINDLYTNLPDDTSTVKLGRVIKSIIIDEDDVTRIPLGFVGYKEDYHILMAFKNTVYIHPTAYTIENDILILDEPLALDTIVTIIVIWIEGDVLLEKFQGLTVESILGLTEALNQKADEVNVYNKDEVYNRQEIDDRFNGIGDGSGQGGNVNTDDITQLIREHNISKESHADLRKKITDVYDGMTPLRLKQKVIKLIPNTEGQTEFNVNMDGLTEDKYAHILLINSDTSVEYKLGNRKLILNNPSTISDIMNLILFWNEGNIISIDNAPITPTEPQTDVGWDDLDDNLQDIIDNKVDKNDVYTKEEVNAMLEKLLNQQPVDAVTRAELTALLEQKADKLNVYGKSEVYQKSEVYNKNEIEDKLRGLQGNQQPTPPAPTVDAYTRQEVDTKLSQKADSTNVYSRQEVDTKLSQKVDSGVVYNKTEIDGLIATLESKITGAAGIQIVPIAQSAYDALSDAEKNSTTKIYAVY